VIAAARADASGLLQSPSYKCVNCISTMTHTLRGCSGATVRQLDGVAILETQPRPIDGAPPAYPAGWFSISAETQANLGFRLSDTFTHDAEAGKPIAHCLRLQHNSAPVNEWLVLYSLITTGLVTAPSWTTPAYSAIMLGIRGVQKGIEYARATAHNRTVGNG